MATIEELLKYGKEQLEASGNEYAKYERKVLLEEVLGMSYMQMLMSGDETVPEKSEQKYKELIEKRCSNYPLQYITGRAHFMDYTFFVDENVLIPRNDTEILVERACDIIKNIIEEKKSSNDSAEILDLCCGSGCIGISLKLYYEDISLSLSDISEKALEVTRKNLEANEKTAYIYCGDLFEPLSGKAFDVIVCNPPYIEHKIISTLMPEVKDYEPHLALDGGEDGLDFYRKIIETAPLHLKDGGCLMFEIGYNQGEQVKSLMNLAGFKDIQLEKDYAGLDRVVYGHL